MEMVSRQLPRIAITCMSYFTQRSPRSKIDTMIYLHSARRVQLFELKASPLPLPAN